MRNIIHEICFFKGLYTRTFVKNLLLSHPQLSQGLPEAGLEGPTIQVLAHQGPLPEVKHCRPGLLHLKGVDEALHSVLHLL